VRRERGGASVNAIYDAAIVGAGPTGLTVANFLGQAGLRVALVERHSTTVREPRAVSIDDESLRTLQAIGLAGDVIADCALDYGSHYFTPSGVRFARVEPKTREYGYPRRNAFRQPLLEATLRRGLDRFASVETLFGHVCEEVVDDGDSLRIRLSDPSGAPMTIEARYLVGADGARSGIRRMIGANLSGSTYEQPWLIVDLASTRERLRQTRVVCDPDRPFITLPGPDGIRRYEFMLRPHETEEQVTDPGFVHALLAASGPDADEPVVRRQVYTFHARIADRWRAGRILLAGDAAHLSPPFAGQGMNSGLRDAHGLAWRLVETATGRIGDGLLDSYQRERSPHAAALIDLAVRMGKVMMPTSRLQARFVQGGFRALRALPRVHSYFAEMKYKPKPSYKEGFLTTEAGGDGLVGRMLPQPCVETIDRRRLLLDDRLGAGFSLIAVGPDSQRALNRARRLDFGVLVSGFAAVLPQAVNPDRAGPALEETVRDVSGALDQVFARPETMIALVRPDRYVCAASTEAQVEALSGSTRQLVASCDAGAGAVSIRSPVGMAASS
jgi:3-(3-hydroxy-phenyl)propionate hydroxylase